MGGRNMALTIVNSKEEMTDTSQQYVLASTGTIWQYSNKTVTTNPTNQIKKSVDSSNNPFNGGQGWKTGYRLHDGDGTEKTLANYEITGYIPITYNDTFRIKNFTSQADHYNNICFYNSSFTFVKPFTGSSSYNPLSQFIKDDGTMEGSLSNLSKTNATTTQLQSVAYIRLSLLGIDNTTFLTINEPLEPVTTTISDWYDTGVKYQDTSEDVARLETEVEALQTDLNILKRYMGLHV
jgi:hypothetical protein